MAEVPEQFKDIPGAYSLSIKGRLMWFKPLGAGQLMLLQRFRARLASLRNQSQDDDYMKLAFDTSVKTLNVIDSLFLDPADRDWVEDSMISGHLELQDVMPIITGMRTDAPDDDAEIEVVPKIVKAKKAATVVKKTTANGRRTKL